MVTYLSDGSYGTPLGAAGSARYQRWFGETHQSEPAPGPFVEPISWLPRCRCGRSVWCCEGQRLGRELLRRAGEAWPAGFSSTNERYRAEVARCGGPTH